MDSFFTYKDSAQMLSVSDIYSLRFHPKLPLPKIIQENIAKLRIHHRPTRPIQKVYKRPSDNSNWRKDVLVDIVRRVKEREDPEYSNIFAIFNKITKSSTEKLSNDTAEFMKKRDAAFRLRVSTLLFDNAITNHNFASVMADCGLILSKTFPDMIEDIHTQIGMFDTLYNMNETIICSDDTIVEWTKQKEKRKGFAKFVMELFIRNIVDESIVQKSLEDVMQEIRKISELPKSMQTEENIQQFAVFIFETAKLIPPSNIKLRENLKHSISDILSTVKFQMKTKFKLEDALKLVS